MSKITFIVVITSASMGNTMKRHWLKLLHEFKCDCVSFGRSVVVLNAHRQRAWSGSDMAASLYGGHSPFSGYL